jgi:nicotinamide-nucleotide amidase
MIPAGSIPLDPVGTAPGVVVPGPGTTIVVLPGPPRELQGMWPAALATDPVASILSSAPSLRVASMKMFGVPESTIAKSLREIGEEIDIGRLEITTCLRRGAELEIDVSYEAEAEELREALFDGLRRRHDSFIYTETGESIDDLVATALAGRTLALAESCSAGLLAARITDRPGSSSYFAGGVVAYSDRAKAELLGVDPALIASQGAVSPEVAEAMADGALGRFAADLAVGVTGIAGPGGGSEDKPVGYVCICVKDADGGRLARDPKLPGGRGDVRDRSVAVSLHMLHRMLSGGDLPI